MSEQSGIRVVHNPAELRYELRIDGELAGEIRYVKRPGTTVLVQTDIEPSREGQGLASQLVRGALDDLRVRGERVVVICPYVGAYMRRHPEYDDLVDPPE